MDSVALPAANDAGCQVLLGRLAQHQQLLSDLVLVLGQNAQQLQSTPCAEQKLSQQLDLLDQALDGLVTVRRMLSPSLPDGTSPADLASQPRLPLDNGAAQSSAAAASPASWAQLPPDLLASILHPSRAGKHARLVCRLFRDAHDAGVQRATLRLPLPASAIGPNLPPAPACARVLRLDAVQMDLGGPDRVEDGLSLGWIAHALGTLHTTAPLELDIRDNRSGAGGAATLASALRCYGFAAGGLQALDLGSNPFGDDGIQLLAGAFYFAQQLSALRHLNLSSCDMRIDGASLLFAALQAATHITRLTSLNLSCNVLMPQGCSALAACLRACPHLCSSLRQLVINNIDIGLGEGDAASPALASAIADCHLSLTVLNVCNNFFSYQDTSAWAGLLATSTSLAGLEVLDLGGNSICDEGIATLAAALQAATHLAQLRALGLSGLACGPAGIARLAELLRDAAHLRSVHELNLSWSDLSGDAMAVFAAVALATDAHLPRLRSLDLNNCRIGMSSAVQHLCAALAAGTHLTCLQVLDLELNELTWAECKQLVATLTAATHLSGLRKIALGGDPLDEPERFAELLPAAPHARGLTALVLWHVAGPGPLATFHTVLCNLPYLRRLEVKEIRVRDDVDEAALVAALQQAPCAPSLEELDIGWCRSVFGSAEDSAATVPHLAAALRACTRLAGLRRLALGFAQLSEVSCMLLGAALVSSPHLACLRELQIVTCGDACDIDVMREKLRALFWATDHLAGVRIYMP